MGRKTGSGQGSIFKQGNTWRGQITLNGKRKSVSGKTKKEVVKQLTDLKYQYDHNKYAERSDLTFGEWYAYWIKQEASKTMTEESLHYVQNMMDHYLTEDIRNTCIQDITKESLENLYDEKLSGLSINTVRAFSMRMKRCLEAAVDYGILVSNPHNKVRMCKARKPKKVFAYTDADQKKIVRYCKGECVKTGLFYFLIGTGMRFGEAAALTWDDVDLNTGAINIWKTTTRGFGGTIVRSSPKTESGVRVIYIGDNILDWLKKYHSKATDRYVFPSSRGGVLSQSTAIRWWGEICDELDIPKQGMHSLRHSWATRALEAGIDVKTVSNMLGHKSVITTMNTYQDVFASQKIKAACTLNAHY